MFVETPRTFLGDFGVDATINAATVRGLFVAPYGEAFGMVAGSRPQFILASTETASVGDVFVLSGNSYEVAEVQTDGTAFKTLVLEDI